MIAENFAEAVKLAVIDTNALDLATCYENPPGRKPSQRLLDNSNWYRSLSEQDRSQVVEVMKDASHSAVFGLFCVLDGVRPVEDTVIKGHFKIYHCAASGERTRIIPTNTNMLHDLLNAI